jgi:putative acetyltransferase
MRIREEMPGDAAAIREIVSSAFGRPDEAELIEALRRDGDLVVALVAVDERERLVGHMALSRLASPPGALALAPVAVRAGRQRQGVGSMLVRGAIEEGRRRGFDALLVVGDPGYYGRFGFSAEAAMPLASPFAGPHFMLLRLTDAELPLAPLVYAKAFAALD